MPSPAGPASTAPRLLGVAALALAGAGALSTAPLPAGAVAAAGGARREAAVPSDQALGGAAVSSEDAVAAAEADRRLHQVRVERSVRVSRDAPRRPLAVAAEKAAGDGASATAERATAAAWRLPVASGSYRLTARFGQCSGLWSHCHTGLDFAAPTGTPVLAVAGGVVEEAAYAGAYGNRLLVRLDDGTELWFCHLTSFAVGHGDRVAPGQTIGAVGSTGNTTGPHLHLEVHPAAGDPVDPDGTLRQHGVTP